MKVFLALGMRESILGLTFANLAYDKSDFLDLVDFAIVDRFLILSPTLSSPTPAIPLGIS